jgi:xylono-1,5-lactonase
MTTVTRMAHGYELVEGPRPDSDGNLYFSDRNGGGIFCMSPDGSVKTVLPDRRLVGGLALHRDGGIVMSGSDVIHWTPSSTRILLEVEGVEFFNDLHVGADGSVYVGSVCSPVVDIRLPRETGHCWRIAPDGSTSQFYGGVSLANGIGFSPDGTRMYHVDSSQKGFWIHDVDGSGSARNGRLVTPDAFQRGIPDGMCVDVEGCLWVAHVAGHRVVRIREDGSFVSEIPVPARTVTSVVFAGPDLDEMYIVTADSTDDPGLGGSIFHCTPGVQGVPTPLATV